MVYEPDKHGCNCGVPLDDDNVHPNGEHEACRKCGDKAEVEDAG